MRGWTVLRIGGRRAATTPQVQCGDRGPGRWPRGHATKGRVPDATGITPSGAREQGRQGCRREVSAQGRDERLTAYSEPVNKTRTPSTSKLALHQDIIGTTFFVRQKLLRTFSKEMCTQWHMKLYALLDLARRRTRSRCNLIGTCTAPHPGTRQEEGRRTSPADNSFVRYCRGRERLQRTNWKEQRVWSESSCYRQLCRPSCTHHRTRW